MAGLYRPFACVYEGCMQSGSLHTLVHAYLLPLFLATTGGGGFLPSSSLGLCCASMTWNRKSIIVYIANVVIDRSRLSRGPNHGAPQKGATLARPNDRHSVYSLPLSPAAINASNAALLFTLPHRESI